MGFLLCVIVTGEIYWQYIFALLREVGGVEASALDFHNTQGNYLAKVRSLPRGPL